MSSYPSFSQGKASRVNQLAGRQIDRATNGRPRARVMFTAVKKEFSVLHHVLTAAEKATLEAFYAANTSGTFDFRWAADGVTYTVMFGQQDIAYTLVRAGRWDAAVQLVEA